MGDHDRAAYCFIEFEDATPNSVFSHSKRYTPEWGSRFEHGFSQIVDWAYKLADLEKSDTFEARFYAKEIESMSILVIGRSDFITESEWKRLQWRRKYVMVNSQYVRCMTFNQLLEEMDFAMNTYPAAVEAEADTQDIDS